MYHFRVFALALFIFCMTVTAYAQGFSTVNGRNHPELHWQEAETPHFRIMYPTRLAGIEVAAALIAEATYATLSANLSVTFGDKIRIYLSDEDEITNGFAVPLGNGYTDIWVNANEAADEWTGRDKWLRKVLAHELTHLFHFRAVRSNVGLLSYFLGDPLPRFFTEGLAQYETEPWDAFRGERWLRTAVLDDQLSYDDGRSAWNGRLLYAVGNAQVRYLADHYGDSTLVRLLHHRKPVFFGLGKTHDFYTAFKAVTGKTYRAFYDEWRRYVNVYYNTLSGYMETADSLGVDALGLPGQYLYDVRYSPDTSRIAVLSLVSTARPVRRLFVADRVSKKVTLVAEGAIKAGISWSPDGRRLAYARRTRGEHGSLLYDLFLVDVDGKNRRRLTHSRRAVFPTFSPDGRRLAFIGSTNGTANVFLLDVATGHETQASVFTGDVQLAGLRWHPSDDRISFARFDADGRRDITVLDLTSGKVTSVTDGTADDRSPVWSPDGRKIAFTSLRDGVPNVFVHDFATGLDRRVTYLATGASVSDWLPPHFAQTAGTLAVITAISKQSDRAYRIAAGRFAAYYTPPVRKAYAAWTTHRPPHEVPPSVPPDTALITGRHQYRALKNITHIASFGLPYYNNTHDWGISGLTAWTEPLGKHSFLFLGTLSVADHGGESNFSASYINRTLTPTVGLNLYRFPGDARYYGSDVLAEQLTGGDLTATWPLDWGDQPFVSTTFGLRLRYAAIDPLDPENFEQTIDNLPIPESGRQADVRLSFTRRKQRPYRDNVIHPLDGVGVRLRLTAAGRLLGADSEFLRGDVAAFGIVSALGMHRLFLYGRFQAQTGRPLAQDIIGLSRRDDIRFTLPGFGAYVFGDAERVRGYRRYAVGNRVAFGTMEYRVPLVPDLQTRLLGIVSLRSAALAAFADGGLVWTDGDFDRAVERLGIGVEVKNALNVGGVFEIMHALGIAQPATDLFSRDHYDLYYRIRAAVPF